MKVSKFLKTLFLVIIGIVILISLVDAKSKIRKSEANNFSPIEKNRKSKKGSTDPEKSSSKRPTGTSPVNFK